MLWKENQLKLALVAGALPLVPGKVEETADDGRVLRSNRSLEQGVATVASV